jgi:hypothetical protein
MYPQAQFNFNAIHSVYISTRSRQSHTIHYYLSFSQSKGLAWCPSHGQKSLFPMLHERVVLQRSRETDAPNRTRVVKGRVPWARAAYKLFVRSRACSNEGHKGEQEGGLVELHIRQLQCQSVMCRACLSWRERFAHRRLRKDS